jgi:hypothetical protein
MKKTVHKAPPKHSLRLAKKKVTRKRVVKKVRQSPLSDDSHGKVVASCPEFTLYADGWLKSSPSVELAMKRARFANTGRRGAEDRLKLKLALWNLMEDAAGQFTGEREDLLEALTESLGQILLDALNKAEGADRRARAAAKKVSSCLADVGAAITQMVRYRRFLPMPGDRSAGAWTWILQYTAKTLFRETKERPRKSSIRLELEPSGWGFRGHDPKENWSRVFSDAGLGSLPS